MAEGSGFFRELKRRHVWRVAVAYAIGGWLLVQVATQVFPFFDVPNWFVRVVVVLLALGFPVSLALAWIYEITPEGIRRTEPVGSPEARPERDRRQIGRRLNAVIITTLVLAVALLGWRLYAERHARAPNPVARAPIPASAGRAAINLAAHATDSTSAVESATTGASPIPAKSIAVLPFENLSNDKDNEYFVSGMQDLILTKLADIGELKVISRASTRKYASHPEDLKTVSRQLGVATLLEGSVQKAGNQVLINVQLIDANSDSHLWADSYTRTLDNVFGVEGEVAEQVAQALKAKLSPAESAHLATGLSPNSDANDLFLRAEFHAIRGQTNYDTTSWRAAIPLYRQAVEKDPNFALAYARLSYTEGGLASFGGGGEDIPLLHRRARADAERAVRLAPDLAAAQLAFGFSDYYGRDDYAAAQRAFAAALALRPNDVDVLEAMGWVQRRRGDFDAGIASLVKAFALDPRNSELAFELGMTDMMVGRYPQAQELFANALAIDAENRNARVFASTLTLFRTGDLARALAMVPGVDPQSTLQRVQLLTWQRHYAQALARLESVPDRPDIFRIDFPPKALQQADLYRLSGDPARARPLYARAQRDLTARLASVRGVRQAYLLSFLGNAELGLGRVAQGLDALAQSQAIIERSDDHTDGPTVTVFNVLAYARAARADLAVPLLTRTLATLGIGKDYSPVLLWLDPAWDPIRNDPGFQALLKQYEKFKPAAIPPVPAASTGGGVHE